MLSKYSRFLKNEPLLLLGENFQTIPHEVLEVAWRFALNESLRPVVGQVDLRERETNFPPKSPNLPGNHQKTQEISLVNL